MLFNMKLFTNREVILISTRLLLTLSHPYDVLFLHFQLSGIFIFILLNCMIEESHSRYALSIA